MIISQVSYRTNGPLVVLSTSSHRFIFSLRVIGLYLVPISFLLVVVLTTLFKNVKLQ